MITLPEKVKEIIDVLMAAGYEAYAVGGCVRDSLLCRIPQDWDITTSATPQQVKELFQRTVDTGIQHGTVTVLIGKEGFEVTTYRIDGEYEDGRHPKEVTFTSLLSEDLRRRDFTINAMAYNDRDGLIDLFGGRNDLERRVIRAVGVATERFSEDALRIMRAVRFAAQLGYEIDEETAKAAKELAPNLQKISAERVRTELVKLMVSDNPERLKTAYELGITREVFPEFDVMMETIQNNPHHRYSVGEHTIHAFCNIRSKDYEIGDRTVLRLGLLFHDIGKPICKTTDENGIDHFHGHGAEGERLAKEILRRLKFDNKTIAAILGIVKYHDIKPRLTEAGVRRAINMVGLDTFRLIFAVQRADIDAQSDYEREDKLNRLSHVKKLYDEIMDRKDPLFIKDLAIGGNDLISEKIAEGKQIGFVLSGLLDEVLVNPDKNNRDILLGLAREIAKEAL